MASSEWSPLFQKFKTYPQTFQINTLAYDLNFICKLAPQNLHFEPNISQIFQIWPKIEISKNFKFHFTLYEN